MTEAEMIAWIDNADIEALLLRRRFGPVGSPWFEGAVGEHYGATMARRRSEAGAEAWTAASKFVGWE